MDELSRNVRVALRGFARTPGFTITAILILAIGIGMATIMSTVYQTLLADRLPVVDQERLVALHPINRGGLTIDAQAKELKTLARESGAFAAVGGVWHYGAVSSALRDGDHTITMMHAGATANFFDVIGARPYLGRLLHAEDGAPGAPMVMVLSYGAWRRRFGADPNVIGRRFHHPIFDKDMTLVGVAPPGLDYPAGVDWWDSPGIAADNMSTIPIARLKAGATTAQARDEFVRLMRDVFQRAGAKDAIIGADVVSLADEMLGKGRTVVSVLAAAVALLLAITCMNVGGLFLVRVLSRSRELAVRRAVGADSGAVARQLIVEAGLIALGGGLIGFGIATATLRVLAMTTISNLPRLDALAMHATPLLTALAITSAAMLMFGVGPAIMAAGGDLATTLRLDVRAGFGTRRTTIVRQILVAAQVALALTTISGAGLLARSLARLESQDLGFQPDNLTIFSLSYPFGLYSGPALPLGLRLLPRIRSVPGVVSAAPIEAPPFLGDNIFLTKFALDGQSSADADRMPFVPMQVSDAEIFRTLGLTVVRGRPFLPSDDEHSEPVAVVSERLAERLWPAQDPIGRFIVQPSDTVHPRARIIGVVRDTHFRNLKESTGEIYFEWRQAAFWNPYVAIRTRGAVKPILDDIQRALDAEAPGVIVAAPHTMTEYLDGPLAQPRVSTAVMIGFALLALVLSALGVYGVLAVMVRERTREIGIRIALGATPRRVGVDVARAASAMLGIGILFGLGVAYVAGRAISSLLFEVKPADPAVMIGAAVVLAVVGFTASGVPAMRASRTDPAIALQAHD